MSIEERQRYGEAVRLVKSYGCVPVTREYIEHLLDLQQDFDNAYHRYQEAGCEEPMDEFKMDALLTEMNEIGDIIEQEMLETFGAKDDTD